MVPWSRLPRHAFSLMLVLMSAHIAALAYASGAAHSEITILFTFVVALGASFLPVRASVAQLCVIAIMLTVLLLIVGRSGDTRLEVIRITMLLATLVVLCGLVLVMRAMLTEEQLALRMRGRVPLRRRAPHGGPARRRRSRPSCLVRRATAGPCHW